MNLRDRIDRALLTLDLRLGPGGSDRRPPPGVPAATPVSRGGRVPAPRGAPRPGDGQLDLGLLSEGAEDPGACGKTGVPEPSGAEDAADRILRAERALRAAGGDVWECFEYALRSDLPVDDAAAAFAALALLCGPEAAWDRSRPEVRAVRAAAFKVRREVHRLLGLLRFAPDDGGVWTARCEPDHDVLDLLLPAFLLRFGSEPFRIEDLRRGRSVSREPSAPARAPRDRRAEEPGVPADSGAEDLWRVYYGATENPARRNPRLRAQFMPRRYWKHLPELDA